MIIIGIFWCIIMIFSELVFDLQDQLKKDLAQIRFLLKKNPATGYARIVEIGKEVTKATERPRDNKPTQNSFSMCSRTTGDSLQKAGQCKRNT